MSRSDTDMQTLFKTALACLEGCLGPTEHAHEIWQTDAVNDRGELEPAVQTAVETIDGRKVVITVSGPYAMDD